MDDRRRSIALTLGLAAVLAAVLAGDGLWRERPHRAAPGAAPTALPEARPTGGVAPRAGGASPPESATVSARSRAADAAAAARVAAWEEVRGARGVTYLGETVAAADSVVRHWASRGDRALRVAVAPADVRGFEQSFAGAARWAIGRWAGIGLPLRFEVVTDSTHADVVVTWRDSLGPDRAGQADVTWNGDGEIVKARVFLATHGPDGAPLVAREMVTMALHEMGHALGLGHSPDEADALHPEALATDLTARDRRTALLLYSLPTGSVRR